ncbi:hypothetical protein [Acinetobacter equi]|uniref:Uncharacterized protein n=1 Tax=Acinetobacter equi TaxID=1324350 RepID=A0A0N9VQQ7_9GAMM|nr:hypothetical protein [Acinetobacter equi]ALH95721.1 hypothetical protein AOY20_09370 [Acinetobacter equi]
MSNDDSRVTITKNNHHLTVKLIDADLTIEKPYVSIVNRRKQKVQNSEPINIGAWLITVFIFLIILFFTFG